MVTSDNIFKSVVISADSKDAAIEKSPFKQLMIDATAAYTNFLEKKLGYDKNFRKSWMEKHGTKKTNKDGEEVLVKATPADYRNMLIDSADISEAEFLEWEVAFTKDKTKNYPGAACMITLTPAVESTRKRPYEYFNVKNEGKRKATTVISLINKRTGEEIWRSDTHITKVAAIKKAKELMSAGKVKDSIEIRLSTNITNPVLGTLQYTPSAHASVGKFVVFGVVDASQL